MAKFIVLTTNAAGDAAYVNPDHITCFVNEAGVTKVFGLAIGEVGRLVVRESTAEIAALIEAAARDGA